MAEAGKEFSAERLRRQKMANSAASAASTTLRRLGASAAGESDSPLAAEVRALRSDVALLTEMMRQHFVPPPPPPAPSEEEIEAEAQAEADAMQRQREEISLLKTELRALARSIHQTKSEIVQLRTSHDESDRLEVVAGELDAVVGATERATDNILEAAERIDTLSQSLKSYAGDQFIAGLAAELNDCVMSVFENCNFQDITGQRIRKVVNTLKFVEERVDKMMDIWGHEEFEGLIAENPIPEDDERRLLNGPQLDGMGISQDDIDKLFG